MEPCSQRVDHTQTPESNRKKPLSGQQHHDKSHSSHYNPVHALQRFSATVISSTGNQYHRTPRYRCNKTNDREQTRSPSHCNFGGQRITCPTCSSECVSHAS
eukprot:1945320-Amphidinium_carterae.1